MNQPHSLGEPPPGSGGRPKEGDGDYARRHNASYTHNRVDSSEFRVHRHDSRDQGTNPTMRDWRRPQRPHDVCRRDDRGFKDRWKDRKRWDKARPREITRDMNREYSRDSSRDQAPEYSRRDSLWGQKDSPRDSGMREYSRSSQDYSAKARISYDDDRRDERRRPSFPKTDSRQDTRPPALGSNSYRDNDLRAPKKFTKRPGDKFRDLIMGTDKTARPYESRISSTSGSKAPQRPVSAVDSKQSNESKDHEPRREYSPPTTSEFPSKPRVLEPESGRELETKSESISSNASEKETYQKPAANGDPQPQARSEADKEQVDVKKELEKQSELPRSTEPKLGEPQSEATPATCEDKTKSTEASADSNGEVQISDDAETSGSDSPKEPHQTLEDPTAKISNVADDSAPSRNSKDLVAKLKGKIRSSGSTDTFTKSDANSDAKKVKETEFKVASANVHATSTEGEKPMSSIEPVADKMDVDSPPVEESTQSAAEQSTEPATNSAEKAESPVKREAMMLPQELEFHEQLVKLYTLISSKVEPAAYTPKRWELPDAATAVVANVRKRTEQVNSDIRVRMEEFDQRRETWINTSADLDNQSSAAAQEKGSKKGSRATSVSFSTPQQQVQSPNSRKRSRDEENQAANNRRNRDRHSRAHGDVARSEAEFLEILANLEAQTARDPLIRARLTSAHVPNQNQEPSSFKFFSTNALVEDHSVLLNRLKVDAIDTFTEDQHLKFIEAYIQWPKEFGKIANVVGCSFNECVMHYYRTKKQADYKKILTQRTKKKRGRKPRKRLDEEVALPSSVAIAVPASEAINGTQAVPPTAIADEVAPLSQPALDSQDDTASASKSEGASTTPLASLTADGKPELLSGQMPMEVETPEGVSQGTGDSTFEDSEISSPKAAKNTQMQKSQTQEQVTAPGTVSPPVPPPVLPLHQMDTLATAALLNPPWPNDKVKQFEELLSIYGSKFEEIAAHLNEKIEEVIRFYHTHEATYKYILDKVDSQGHSFSSMPVHASNGFPRLVEKNASRPMEAGGGLQPSLLTTRSDGLPQQAVVVPMLVPAKTGQNLDGPKQMQTASSVPPPVMPIVPKLMPSLEESDPAENGVAAVDTSLSNGAAFSPSTPSPSAEAYTRSSNVAAAPDLSVTKMEIWDDLVSINAIPPILPRSSNGQSSYNAFYGIPPPKFGGFRESNIRH